MRNIRLTAKNELRMALGRKPFWVSTLLMLAVIVFVGFIPQIFSSNASSSAPTAATSTAPTRPLGYVDPGGLLPTTPTGIPPGTLRSYKYESQAQEALRRGEIEAYYLIPPDYVSSGRLIAVEARYQPLHALQGSDLIIYVITTGLTGDQSRAKLLLHPTAQLEKKALAPAAATESANAVVAYAVPYLFMFILYISLALTSGFMLQSVSKEKENRTAELLLVSIKPRDLMLGKIAGLSGVGLIQVALWLIVGLVILGRGQTIGGVSLSIFGGTGAQLIPWALAYFLLGYVMYASIYAVFAVVTPTAREAGHFVFIAIIPLVIPLLFTNTLSSAPNGALATTLSVFPLTAPVSMMARLGATLVPWWQLAAGLIGVGILAYLFVLLAGRLFGAHNLLSSRAASWQRLVAQLRLRPIASATGPSERDTSILTGETASGQVTVRGVSKNRRLPGVTGAAVLVAVGVVLVVRGEAFGNFVLALGVILGVLAYRRGRRGKHSGRW